MGIVSSVKCNTIEEIIDWKIDDVCRSLVLLAAGKGMSGSKELAKLLKEMDRSCKKLKSALANSDNSK